MSPFRRSFAVAYLAAAAILVNAGARADTAVFPTGRFPDDVYSVRGAVANGGIVLLKAVDANGTGTSFNFGPAAPGSGTVTLLADVTLVGETIEGRKTTISGGNIPLRIFTAQSAIRGIHLQGPRALGILVLASKDVEITGNTITDVVPQVISGFRFARGILVGSSAVQGALLISHNIIAGVHGDGSYGIAVSNHTADTRISGNVVTDVDLVGILVGGNTSPVSIDSNVVTPGPGTFPDSLGNGIEFGHTRGGPAYIANNTVICENPNADGILIVGLGTVQRPENDAVIEKNDITMRGSLHGGISLYDQASNNLVRANKISGYGAYALQVGTFVPPGIAEGNSFIGNNISHFVAAVAEVFLDINSHGTIVKGNSGTAIDLGTGDAIGGSASKALDVNVGSRLRQAQALKRRILQAVPDDDLDMQ